MLAVTLACVPTMGCAQVFVNGDSGGILETLHVGGYLGQGVSFTDFNGDGHDDLTFTQFEGNIMAYLGDGSGAFQPHDLGIGNTNGEPKSVLWVDLDNDGDQDMLLSQRLSLNKVYVRMPNGILKELPNAGGMAGSVLDRTYGMSVADYDADGLLDVHWCHYHTNQNSTETNRLYRGTGGVDLDLAFEDVTDAAGIGNGVKESFQSTWIDIDRDGWLDLHVINDRTFWPDALYRNLGDGTFVDMADEWGIDIGQYSMSSSCADFDKDLDWDMVVTNGATEGNSFLLCQGSPFVEQNSENSGSVMELEYVQVADSAGILLNDLAWGALWFDANNDSWLDLYIGTGTSLYTDYPSILDLFPSTENGFFINNEGSLPIEPVADNALANGDMVFSSAVADHNGDGALDFVSHRVGKHAGLFNGVPNGNHWLQISLEPHTGNADAIGARVTAWLNGRPDVRTVTCGSEYLNQNSRRLHFGMGSSNVMDSVVVDWTSGQTTVHEYLPSDMHLTLFEQNPTEEASGCTYQVACNYNPMAAVDDGSCDWSCLCGMGTVYHASLGECVSTCTADQNGDGFVGTSDLLVFLNLFGLACE